MTLAMLVMLRYEMGFIRSVLRVDDTLGRDLKHGLSFRQTWAVEYLGYALLSAPLP